MRANAPVIDLSNGSVITMAYLERVRRAGVDVCGITVLHRGTAQDAARELRRWLAEVEAHRDLLAVAADGQAVRRAQTEGRLALLLTVGNADVLEGDPRVAATLAGLGLRMVQLTGNGHGTAGDGCGVADGGLTPVGRRLIEAMNRSGVIVDLAHAGDRTLEGAVDASSAPVVVSHTAARSLCPHPRNLTDHLMRRVAARGGVVGICPFPAFLKQGAPPALEDLFRHLDHALEVAGPEHVALSSDMIEGKRAEDYAGLLGPTPMYPDWPWEFPAGFRTIDDLPGVVARLRERYPEPIVQGLVGANALRVLDDVTAAAAAGHRAGRGAAEPLSQEP